MKHLIALCLFNTLLADPVFAVFRTVDNSPGSSADFESVQVAIDSSSDGDTLLVQGSGINYGDVMINRPITLLGDGWCPDSLTRLENVRIQNSNVQVSGFEIKYVLFDAPSASGDSLTTVLLSNCKLGDFVGGSLDVLGFMGLNGSAYALLRDIIIRNNYFYNAGIKAWGNACLDSNLLIDTMRIENNIFDRAGFFFRSGAIGLETLVLDHNILALPFEDPDGIFTSVCMGGGFSVYGASITNNIFYAANPAGCEGCTYANNLTYLNGVNDMIPGTGNVIGVDPQFVYYPGTGFDLSYDFQLSDSSLGNDAATDGTDIGVFGGIHPWTGCVFNTWDCPALQANLGDPCEDEGDPDTQNAVGPDCTCDTLNMAVSDHLLGSTLAILPNPAEDRVRVSRASSNLRSPVDLVVVDAVGQVIMRRVGLAALTIELDIAHFGPGAYIVRLKSENGAAHGRFIKD